jgi:hypothetical protein
VDDLTRTSVVQRWLAIGMGKQLEYRPTRKVHPTATMLRTVTDDVESLGSR